MNNRYNTTPAQTYRPEKVNHVRTGVRSLIFMIIYHAVTWLLYIMIMSPLENQMVGDEREPIYRFVMFGFSVLTLLILSVVMAVFYHKNGDRKRAYLAATSVEIRGAENVAEGVSRYRKLALTESLVCALTAGALWVIPSVLYLISLFLWGYGFLYGQALAIEKIFIGFIGLCEPFQNPLVGMLIGMGILFCFHYFGRLYAHHYWQEHRIRR